MQIYTKKTEKNENHVNCLKRDPKKVTWTTMNKITGKDFNVPVYPHGIDDIENALSRNGFLTKNIYEPEPITAASTIDKDMYQCMQCCPQFILYKAIKI